MRIPCWPFVTDSGERCYTFSRRDIVIVMSDVLEVSTNFTPSLLPPSAVHCSSMEILKKSVGFQLTGEDYIVRSTISRSALGLGVVLISASVWTITLWSLTFCCVLLRSLTVEHSVQPPNWIRPLSVIWLSSNNGKIFLPHKQRRFIYNLLENIALSQNQVSKGPCKTWLTAEICRRMDDFKQLWVSVMCWSYTILYQERAWKWS